MKFFFFCAFVFLIVGCSGNPSVKTEQKPPVVLSEIDFSVALDFINAYTVFCNKEFDGNETGIKTDAWIKDHSLLTDDFKKAYKKLMDSARNEDMVYGLGFDPIFNAQDYPEKGFDLAMIDSTKHLVRAVGKDFPLIVELRVVNTSHGSKVDAAGIVNQNLEQH